MAEVWTAQLHIVGGEATEEAPEIAYAERLDDAGRTVRLYLLAEPDRPGSEQFLADLVTDIGEEFVSGSGSLTGLIQRAIRERHLDLLDWNRNSLPRDQAIWVSLVFCFANLQTRLLLRWRDAHAPGLSSSGDVLRIGYR